MLVENGRGQSRHAPSLVERTSDEVLDRLVESLVSDQRLKGKLIQRLADLGDISKGAILSDRDIKKAVETGEIQIDPYDATKVQPSSVDLTLHRNLKVFIGGKRVVDLKKPQESLYELKEIPEDEPFLLQPHECALGIVEQNVIVPPTMAARIEGKSSLGRTFLLVHVTAGFVDPGWNGRLTLELANLLPIPITLYRGMPVAQLSFMRLTSPSEKVYGSSGLNNKYKGDMQPNVSQFYKNFPQESPAQVSQHLVS